MSKTTNKAAGFGMPAVCRDRRGDAAGGDTKPGSATGASGLSSKMPAKAEGFFAIMLPRLLVQ